jgi:mRNA-degrading endonuclease RelE of RelBE toxin-antitoxin system
VTYTIIWTTSARTAYIALKARDPNGIRKVTQAVNALAHDPEPSNSFKAGDNVRRLHIGTYRVTYHLDGTKIAITVLIVGKVSG